MNAPKPPSLDFEQLFRAFLDFSPAVAWMKDAQGRHVYLSKPYIEKIGIPCEDWFGKTDFELWPHDVAERFVEHDHQILKTNSILRFEDQENVSFKNGNPRDWWVVKFPIQDVDGNMYVGGMAIDITERKLAENERHLLTREMAGIVAREQRKIGQDLHDGIGQELTALDLFASSLKDKLEAISAQLPDADFDLVNELAAKVSSGLSQTNQTIRAASRGLMPVKLDCDNLVSALEELAEMTRQIKNIDCRIQCIDLGKHSVLRTKSEDNSELPDQLYRIAQEAVNNSVKHSMAELIRIKLIESRDGLTLRVWDNGNGISQAQQNEGQIRKPGLGLRIMNYRAKLVGAELEISSDQDGTAIECKLKANSNE